MKPKPRPPQYLPPDTRWVRANVRRSLRKAMARLTLLAFAAFAYFAPVARTSYALDVILEWEAPASLANVAGYRIHYGPASGAYQFTRSIPKTSLTATITNLPNGAWYFAATSISTNGIQSDFSNEVAATLQALGPLNLKLSGPRDALLLQSAPSPSGPWKTIAIITSTNAPLMLQAAGKSHFRTISTNLPPLPR